MRPTGAAQPKGGQRPQRLETNYPNVIMRAHGMGNGNFMSSAWGECPLKIVLPPVGRARPNALVLSAWLNRMGIGHIILIADNKMKGATSRQKAGDAAPFMLSEAARSDYRAIIRRPLQM